MDFWANPVDGAATHWLEKVSFSTRRASVSLGKVVVRGALEDHIVWVQILLASSGFLSFTSLSESGEHIPISS